MKTECSMCNGTGQDYEWVDKNKIPVYVITDCENCDGKGIVNFVIVDKRKNSKKKKRLFPKQA